MFWGGFLRGGGFVFFLFFFLGGGFSTWALGVLVLGFWVEGMGLGMLGSSNFASGCHTPNPKP